MRPTARNNKEGSDFCQWTTKSSLLHLLTTITQGLPLLSAAGSGALVPMEVEKTLREKPLLCDFFALQVFAPPNARDRRLSLLSSGSHARVSPRKRSAGLSPWCQPLSKPALSGSTHHTLFISQLELNRSSTGGPFTYQCAATLALQHSHREPQLAAAGRQGMIQ